LTVQEDHPRTAAVTAANEAQETIGGAESGSLAKTASLPPAAADRVRILSRVIGMRNARLDAKGALKRPVLAVRFWQAVPVASSGGACLVSPRL